MSNWVNISGSVQLETGIYKYKLDKNNKIKRNKDGWGIYFLPYPASQIFIDDIKQEGNNFKVDIIIFSQPIISGVVSKNIKTLNAGEHDEICHVLFSNCHVDAVNFSEGNLSKTLKKEIKSKVENLIRERYLENPNIINSWEINSIQECYHSILCINDSIRWGNCTETYNQLIEFFDNLIKEDVIPKNGIITFEDVYPKRYTMRFVDEGIIAEIYSEINKTTKYNYYKLCWNEEYKRPLQILKQVNSEGEFYKEED